MEDLHRCWFCDSFEVKQRIYRNNNGWNSQVICEYCGAKGPLLEGFPEEGLADYCAAEKWNSPLFE